MTAVRYRLAQAWAQVSHRRRDGTIPPDLAPFLNGLITPAFQRLALADRQHLIDVAMLLQDAGWDGDVVSAGLLHDIGKASEHAHIRITDRGLWVMVRNLSPSLARRFAGYPTPPRIGKGLWLLAHHARIGSEMLAAAEYGDRVCWMVRHHEDIATHDAALAALIAADDGRAIPARGSFA